jgi:hypothetical protein
MSPERYVTWLTPYQFLHILHQKMEKCLNLLFVHCHSSEHNGLEKMFLEPQNHYIFLVETVFEYFNFL